MKKVEKPSAYDRGKANIRKEFGPFIMMGLVSTGITAPDTGVIPGLQANGKVLTEAQQHAANRNKSRVNFAGGLTFDISSNSTTDHLLAFVDSDIIDYSVLGATPVVITGHASKASGSWVSTIPVTKPNGDADGDIVIVVNGGAMSVDQAVKHILESRPYVSDIKMVADSDADQVQFGKPFGYIEQPTGSPAQAFPLTSIIKKANNNSKDAADTRWFVPNTMYPTDKSGKEWGPYRDFYMVHGAGLNFSLEFNTPIHNRHAY